MFTVYTLPDCQPCRLVKLTLTKFRVPFTEEPLSDHPEVAEEARSRGEASAPIVVSPSGQWVSGFRPEALRALIAAEGESIPEAA